MSELITHHMDCPLRRRKKRKSLDSITGKKRRKKKLQTENRNQRKSQFPGPVCSCVLTKHLINGKVSCCPLWSSLMETQVSVVRGCWCLCWVLSGVFWMSPAPLAGDAGWLSPNWSRARSAGPEYSRWHAGGFPFCSRFCSAGCSAPVPSVWSSSRSCCRAGWEDRPRGSCSARFPDCAPSSLHSRYFSGRTSLGLLPSCWQQDFVEKTRLFVFEIPCSRWAVEANAVD